MIGAVLDGRYHLVRFVGEGGMGAVYEAVHLGTGRRVAIKVIANHELGADQEVVARFQREARAAGRLETRHIVEVIDAGLDTKLNVPFIAMEYLVGFDLGNLIESVGPLPPDLALRIAGQACVGLAKAHAENIVHRDIKPANLFLAHQPDGVVVKLLDFGIAKVPPELMNLDTNVTATGRLMGSPRFMSPEQAQGLKTLDHRTDIWSLGAVLYETLAGRVPFAESETIGQLIVAICSQAPPPLTQIAPWVPLGVIRIVECALRVDPAQRYPTALAMLEDVQLLLPGGVEISQKDVVGISDRRVSPAVAWSPRVTRVGDTRDDPLPPTLASSNAPPPVPARPAWPKDERSMPSSDPGATSSDPTLPSAGTEQASRRPPRKRAREMSTRARAVALVLGAGLAITLLVASSRVGRRHDVTTAEAPESPARPLAPTASAPVRMPAMTVRVGIWPPGARVEVDGRSADATSGTVDIAGALGSVHRVRVSNLGRETSQDVAITEAGPVPGVVGMPPSDNDVPRGSRKPTPAAGADVARSQAAAPPSSSPSAAPTRSSKFSTLNKNFE